jgi:serine/threonine protein kinase/Tfp pilus assembly protein PilF
VCSWVWSSSWVDFTPTRTRPTAQIRSSREDSLETKDPSRRPNTGVLPPENLARDEDLRVTRAEPSRDTPLQPFVQGSTASVEDRVTAAIPSSSLESTKVLSAAFLQNQTVDFTSSSPGFSPDRLPEVEGYTLARRIGQGGMGVVYEGVQQATGRRVAVKFMLDGTMDAAAARKRFEREVDVVAGLQHPGIVSIIDAGVRKGRYFYVMEYVEGKPLDEVFKPGACDVRAAMDLVARVCDAVDYAHQRGVLHRDLKPSNILIDEKGEPHLLDFGLAKRVDRPGEGTGTHGLLGVTIAEPGQLVGTVAYMSPEQTMGRAGEAGVRSDVYALGTIAYELAAGQLPVSMEGSIREVLTRVAEREASPASAHRPGISRDLDAVLLRALEKAPSRRYSTAGAFADDLRRYLTGMPVEARRVGPLGRTWRWVRRNQAIASVIAAAAVILLTVSTWLIARIIVERDRANDNARQANDALVISRQNERYATERLGILKSMLERADPEATGEITVVDLLDATSDGLDAKPPELDLTEAEVRELMGSVYRKFGEYPKAIANLERALALRERHTEQRAELAECLHNLAATLWWDGRYDQAEPLYQRALGIRRELFPGDHRLVAFSLTHLAACRLSQRRITDARDLYQQALDMRRRLLGEEHEEVAQSLNNLAKTYVETGEHEHAEQLFRKALDMIVRIKGEKHGGTAATSINLALCLFDRGDYAGARAASERARLILASLFPRGHHRVASAMVGVARADLALGHAEAARKTAAEARAMYERQARTAHPEFADVLVVMGKADAAMGLSGEALLREALAVLERARPASAMRLALVKADLAEVVAARHDLAEARRLMRESLELLIRETGESSLHTQRLRERIATIKGD